MPLSSLIYHHGIYDILLSYVWALSSEFPAEVVSVSAGAANVATRGIETFRFHKSSAHSRNIAFASWTRYR